MLAWHSVRRGTVALRILHHRQSSSALPISNFLHRQSNKLKSSQKPKPTTIPTEDSNAARSAAQVERATRFRHLLRAILRECTYLPDAWTRQWTKQHTIARFRTYQWKTWKDGQDDSMAERLKQKESEARESLALLRRANEGERDRLKRVMLMAYGRTGKRRHELLRPLLVVQKKDVIRAPAKVEGLEDTTLRGEEAGSTHSDDRTPATNEKDHAAVEEDRQISGDDDAQYQMESREVDLPPRFRALLISQIKAAPPNLTRPNPRRLQPNIPDTNSWHRPMPQSRIRNLRREHYLQLVERALPPLPAEEWYRLRELASRTFSARDFPKRRTPACHRIRSSVSRLPDGALATVATYGKAPRKVFEQYNGHSITSRFMRRLYAEVFSQCPLMELNTDNTEWTFRWGENELNTRSLPSQREKASLGRARRATVPTSTANDNGLDIMAKDKTSSTSELLSVEGKG